MVKRLLGRYLSSRKDPFSSARTILGQSPCSSKDLFRSTKVTDSRGELLIFITPKIVQPNNSDTMIE